MHDAYLFGQFAGRDIVVSLADAYNAANSKVPTARPQVFVVAAPMNEHPTVAPANDDEGDAVAKMVAPHDAPRHGVDHAVVDVHHIDPLVRHRATRRSGDFSASRLDSGERSAFRATNPRTSASSVFEYCRRVQPMALRMKNSPSP